MQAAQQAGPGATSLGARAPASPVGEAPARTEEPPQVVQSLPQGIAVLTLCAVLAASLPSRDAPYRALGAPTVDPDRLAGATLVVRFRPDVTEQEMRRVLRDCEARLVYGPTTTDAYLLGVARGREQAAIARLRQQAAVLLVESLDGGGAR